MEASEPRMPAEPQDEEGTGSSYSELVQESDVPRVGDEGVEGVNVAGSQVKEEETKSTSSSKSTSKS